MPGNNFRDPVNLFATLAAAAVTPIGTITVTAEPFLTASGGETSAPLTIGGVALAGTPTVSAIHRTDWQGRQLLYSTARANYQRQTEALNDTSYWSTSNVTVTASSTQVGGSGPAYWTVQRTASSGSALSSLQPSAATGSIGSTSIFRVWLRAGTVSSCDIGMVGAGTPTSYACTAAIISGPGSVSAGGSAFAPHISGLSTTQDTCIELSRIKPATDTGTATCYIYPNNTGGNTGDSLLVAAPNFFNSLSGAYIPATTTTPITVTDYTLSGSTVSLGQAASAGAVYDWAGNGSAQFPAAFAGPVTVGQYVKAALPSASTYEYALIVVTDATGGPALCLSNGTNWININTNAAVV